MCIFVCLGGVLESAEARDVVITCGGGVIADYELLDGVLETKLWSSAGIVHTLNH